MPHKSDDDETTPSVNAVEKTLSGETTLPTTSHWAEVSRRLIDFPAPGCNGLS